MSRGLRLTLAVAIVALPACTQLESVSYELSYVLVGDSLTQVPSDSLLFQTSSILLMSGEDSVVIAGDLFRMVRSTITRDGEVVTSNMRYSVFSPSNEALADVRLGGTNSDAGFESLYVEGDIARISPQLESLISGIGAVAAVDWDRLQTEGEETVVDMQGGS